jgi:hypothetical protein
LAVVNVPPGESTYTIVVCHKLIGMTLFLTNLNHVLVAEQMNFSLNVNCEDAEFTFVPIPQGSTTFSHTVRTLFLNLYQRVLRRLPGSGKVLLQVETWYVSIFVNLKQIM